MPEKARTDAELLAAAKRRHGGQWKTLATWLGVDPSNISHYQTDGLPRLVRRVFELEEATAPPLPVSPEYAFELAEPESPMVDTLNDAWWRLARILVDKGAKSKEWKAIMGVLESYEEPAVERKPSPKVVRTSRRPALP